MDTWKRSILVQVASFVVSSFVAPTGAITAIYIFAVLQIVGCYQIYCRPTFGFAYNYMLRYSDLFRLSEALSFPKPLVLHWKPPAGDTVLKVHKCHERFVLCLQLRMPSSRKQS